MADRDWGVKPTALGDYLLIVPEWTTDRWLLVAFNRMGRWRGMRVCNTKEDAKMARVKLIRHHKRIAREDEARRKARLVRDSAERGAGR